MSNQVLPLIDKHKYIRNQSTKLNTYRYFSISYKQYYNRRVKNFIQAYEKQSWLSFNLANWKAYNYYVKNKATNTLKKE